MPPTLLKTATLSLMLGTAIAAATNPAGQNTASAKAGRVERGRYLVTIAACNDCHTPKLDAQMTLDTNRLLSGRPQATMPPMQSTTEIKASLDLTAWAGPWGNSYAANLTPDKETGLGSRYTEQSFIQTIRTGKKPEGEALAPPMPWPVYRNMTDEDLKAVYAYLQTLKPIKNAVKTSPQASR
jgi:cytochrome c553